MKSGSCSTDDASAASWPEAPLPTPSRVSVQNGHVSDNRADDGETDGIVQHRPPAPLLPPASRPCWSMAPAAAFSPRPSTRRRTSAPYSPPTAIPSVNQYGAAALALLIGAALIWQLTALARRSS